MKKIIYSLLFVITAVCAACDEELPKASFDLYELKTLTATAGDMNVALSWEAYPDARPDEYLISWTSGSSEAEGGQMTVEAEASGATVSDLVNDVAYTYAKECKISGDWSDCVSGRQESPAEMEEACQRTVYELSDYRKSRQSGYQIG